MRRYFDLCCVDYFMKFYVIEDSKGFCSLYKHCNSFNSWVFCMSRRTFKDCVKYADKYWGGSGFEVVVY